MKTRMQFVLFALATAVFFQGLENSAAEFSNVWKNGLVSIPCGAFVMGSREGNADAQPCEVQVGGFLIGRCEVTVAEFVEYLNENGATNWPGSPQISALSGRYSARWFRSRDPVAFVSVSDAAACCRWLSEITGEAVRLPTEVEWEYAARGGIRRARFPWGWGDPDGRACYGADAPRKVGSFEPNPFGLYDMAGNVFEWCGSAAGEQAPARGGSWSEKDPKFLRVFHRVLFPRDYRDADVGFRIVVEEKQTP
jgi:formylglycine-generating enzyme required for sulfatase activity